MAGVNSKRAVNGVTLSAWAMKCPQVRKTGDKVMDGAREALRDQAMVCASILQEDEESRGPCEAYLRTMRNQRAKNSNDAIRREWIKNYGGVRKLTKDQMASFLRTYSYYNSVPALK